MMREVLEEVIVEFWELGLPEVKERELILSTNLDTALSVFGLRRVGKTHLLYATMKRLMGSGLPLRRLFYVNFEDERLVGMTAKDLSSIVELYHKHNPGARVLYLFLDEVQAVEGWERFVRRLVERGNVRVFLTGSSSKLLSKEIATSLRGRTLSFQLFPLSFREFLEFKGFKLTFPLTEARRGRLFAFLDEYVRYGGFPGIVNYSPLLKIRTLQEYLDLIVYKDLIERYGVEKSSAMKALIRVITRNFARKASVRKLHGFLSSMGVKISKPTVYEYFSYLEDVGFVIPVRKYHDNTVESLRSAPKLYLVDVGFAEALGVEDFGFRLENIVAVELLRRKHYSDPLIEVHYWEGREGEVDFVVSRGSKVSELIQVSWSVEDPETKTREVRALVSASKHLGCRNLKVITWDYEAVETVDGKNIEFLPLWKWLLGAGL